MKQKSYKNTNKKQVNESPTSTNVSAVQKPAEMLLIGSASSDPYSTIVMDPRTGVSTWSYKGSELQGAASALAKPIGVNGDLLLIAIKDRPLLHTLAVHNKDRFHAKTVVSGPVQAFCTSSDGSLLFAAIRTQIFVWLLSTGELLSVTDAHYQNISQIELSEDGSSLFTAANDGAVHIYIVSDLISNDREQTVAPIRKWRAHSLAVKGLSLSKGRDPRVASCGLDHVAAVHSAALDACILKISADRPLTACVLDGAESRLFIGSDLGNIAQINLFQLGGTSELLVQTSDERNEKVPVLNGHSDEITSLAMNGDGSLLASGDLSGRYCVWDIASKQCLKVSSMRGSVTSMSFVPNWPSLSSSDYTSGAKPVFDLQRNPTTGKIIPVRPRAKAAVDLEKWTFVTDTLIENVLMEMSSSSAPAPSKNEKKLKKTTEQKSLASKQAVVEDDDVIVLSDEASPETSSEDKDQQIKTLQEENMRLKKINAQLYEFAAKEIMTD